MTKKNIVSIYEQYRIPPWLAMHMRRVAAVAGRVFDAHAKRADGADNVLSERDRSDLCSACLLHDMGNIIKFNFSVLGEEVSVEGKDHWETVRSDMIARYGRDEHHATLAILDELRVSPRVREIVDAIGFLKNEDTLASGDLLKKIAAYADSRVVPSGIAALADRLQDMHERYATRHPKDAPETERNSKALYDIEKELFQGAQIRPEDITEASCTELCSELTRFDIDCSVG